MPGVMLWGWDSANGKWVKVLVDANGKVKISDADPFTIAQATPENLKHVPCGYYATTPAYLPYKVDSEGRLDVNLHGYYSEGARVYHSADQTLTTGTNTKLDFDSKRYDTDSIHDTVTNNTRLTCKTAGKYLIVTGVKFDGNATGVRDVYLYLNNTTTIGGTRGMPSGTNAVIVNVPTIYNLVVDDYVEVLAYQNSGGDLKVLSFPNYANEFMMQMIGLP